VVGLDDEHDRTRHRFFFVPPARVRDAPVRRLESDDLRLLDFREPFASPAWRRCLLTVAAAICLARLVPCRF
jgi:hypothetical protein